MINGVLVERTIEDVLPSLKTNADGLKQVLDELLKQYKAKQTEMDTWKVGIKTSRWFLPKNSQKKGRYRYRCRDADYRS